METQTNLPQLHYKGHAKSKLTLHLFLQIIGKVRLKSMPRKNHWWYVTEYMDSMGFTTGPMPVHGRMATFTITLNVHKHLLQIYSSDGQEMAFALHNGLSVADFYSQLMDALNALDIDVDISGKPYDLGIEVNFDTITDYHHYDEGYIKTLWQVFLWTDGVFKTYSGRFYGKTCPVHLYWHSMDLAVTRFSGKEAPKMGMNARISDKDAYTHECISCGFWAGDENMPEPAYYSYTYPSPEGITKKQLLPSEAIWIESNGNPMAILRYADLQKSSNPEKDLLDFMESAYTAGASLAGWEIDRLKVPGLQEL